MNNNPLTNGHQKQLTYEAAQQELEEILNKIQKGTISVDELTANVKRSSELLRFCKQKLREVDLAIEQVFEDLENEVPDQAQVQQAAKIQTSPIKLPNEKEEEDDNELPF
jgi:exodeoxyribonuclease VII small subunit